MGLIDIVKPLCIVLSSAINKSQQHETNNSWKCRELNLWLVGEKRLSYLCALQPPAAGEVCGLLGS